METRLSRATAHRAAGPWYRALLAILTFAVLLTLAPAARAFPDGRAAELVSQADSDGNPAVPLDGSFNVLNDNSVVYGNGATLSGDANTGYDPMYLATRGSMGWSQQALIPPGASPDDGYLFLDATPNGTVAVSAQTIVGNLGFTPPNTVMPTQLLVRDGSDVWHTIVSDSLNPSDPSNGDPSLFGGMSASGAEVLYSSYVTPLGLTPAAYAGAPLRKVYRWTAAATTSADGAADPLADCNEEMAGKYDNTVDTLANAAYQGLDTNNVSSGGTYAFLQSGSGGGPACPSTSQVYRSGASGNALISFAQGGAVPTSASTFVGASPDGETAYFVSSGQLTSSPIGTGRFGGPPVNLYEWSDGPGGGTVSCVSCGTAEAGTLGNVLVTPSGQYVYFTEASADSSGNPASILYSWDGSRIEAVDTIALSTLGGDPLGSGEASSNPQGNVLVFPVAQGGGNAPAYDGSAYELDEAKVTASGVSLQCVTCTTGGAAGYGQLGGQSQGQAGLGPSVGPVGASTVVGAAAESMSADGTTVVFNSDDALTPDAVAGEPQEYRWIAGEGPALLTATGSVGTSNRAAEVSPDGQDIFVLSNQALAPDVVTGQVTMYDLRVNGGFPSATSQLTCQGDGCQGAAPSGAAPGSVGSGGHTTGNVRARYIRPVLTFARPAAGALRRGATLRLQVRARGRFLVTATATARLGGESRTIGESRRQIRSGAKIQHIVLEVHLSVAARRRLSLIHHLIATVTLSAPGQRMRRMTLTIGQGGSR